MVKNVASETASEEADFKEILVSVRRVCKVVSGGKRFGFSAVVVVGDSKGRVGYGLGKAKEVAEARTKAAQAARKSMTKIPLREGRTLHHDVIGSFGSGKVVLRSAKAGTGIIAGGPMRAVFEAMGISDIVAKSLGSSNVHNMVGATFCALNNLYSPRQIAEKRSKKIGEIIERRETGNERKK